MLGEEEKSLVYTGQLYGVLLCMESSTLGESRDTGRAMSEENVAVVRSYFDAWNSGDMEAVREIYDPDAIMRAERDWPEPGPFVGRDAVMQ